MLHGIARSTLQWLARKLTPYLEIEELSRQRFAELIAHQSQSAADSSLLGGVESNSLAAAISGFATGEPPVRLNELLVELSQLVNLLLKERLEQQTTQAELIGRVCQIEASRQRVEHDLQLLQNSVQLLQNSVQLLQNSANGMEQIVAVQRNAVQEMAWELRGDLLRQRRILQQVKRLAGDDHLSAPAIRADAKSFAESLAALEPLAPHAFAVWKPLLDVNATCYEGFPTHSCSVAGHKMAALFGCFLSPLLRGAVLDIGCGPQPVPSYLLDYPVSSIAGVDPLAAEHPFLFHQGVAEFLPWDDGAFDVVISATSLDHVLLLDLSLEEFRRVLKPDGRFVTWVSFTAGAPEYQPYLANVGRYDEFHLFHFDRPWFEAWMQRYFRIDEAFQFEAPYNQAFYSLAPL